MIIEGQANTEATQDTNVLDAFNWDSPGATPATAVTIEKVKADETVVEKAIPKPAVVKEKAKEEIIEESELADVFSGWEDEPQAGVKDEESDLTSKPKKKTAVTTVTTEAEKVDSEDSLEVDDDVDFYTTLTKELKENGVFTNIEIKEGEKIDRDTFLDLQDEEVEARAESMVKGLITELKDDPDVAQLMSFVKKGGSARDFFETYATAPAVGITEDMDLKDKKNQIKVISKYLREIRGVEDEEDISDEIEVLEDKGKLQATAEKHHPKLLALDAKVKADLVKDHDNRIKAIRKQNDDLKEKLQSTLDKKDKIGAFTFSKEEKASLADMIVKPTVKIGEGSFIPEFQAKMGAIMKDPEKLLILAKLVRKNFEVDDLVKDLTTKVVNTAKSTLQETRRSAKISGNKGTTTKSLADLF